MECAGPADTGRETTPSPSIDEDQARLEAEIAAVRARLRLANRRLSLGAETTRATIRDLLLVSQRELADAELAHQAALESIRVSAQAEAARILAEARAEADRLLAEDVESTLTAHEE